MEGEQIGRLDDWTIGQRFSACIRRESRDCPTCWGFSGNGDRALAVNRAPTYQREASGWGVDEFGARVRILLASTALIPATAAAERVGRSGSHRCFGRNSLSSDRIISFQIHSVSGSRATSGFRTRLCHWVMSSSTLCLRRHRATRLEWTNTAR